MIPGVNVMDETKARRIKSAVKQNFDAGAELYDEFEDRYGFFGELAAALTARLRLPDAPLILDVGCGSGAAATSLCRSFPGSRVWGLDISSEMIERARAKLGESKSVAFLVGDAAELTGRFDFLFDAVVYTASIFLIPDYHESLTQVGKLLKPDGVVALTFMDGVYDEKGRNSLVVADDAAQLGMSRKRPVIFDAFLEDFGRVFPDRESWSVDYAHPLEAVAAFFSVPPMSAGLFPGIEYSERVRKVQELFSRMTGRHWFRWRFVIGRKGGTAQRSTEPGRRPLRDQG